MREGTLALFYFCKYLELGALLIWSVLTLSQISLTVQVDYEHFATRPEKFGPLILVGVLIIYNLLFNNLLINLRFYCKMRCVTVGLCVYDAVNFVQCECCLNKPCRDRCFTPWTIVKWILKTLVISVTLYILNQDVVPEDGVPLDIPEIKDLLTTETLLVKEIKNL